MSRTVRQRRCFEPCIIAEETLVKESCNGDGCQSLRAEINVEERQDRKEKAISLNFIMGAILRKDSPNWENQTLRRS